VNKAIPSGAYVSSEQGECFQLWIDEPEAGHVSIHAAGVETRSDADLRQDWRVPLDELAQALEDALGHVERWIKRG
jgi:hypothetical protein